MHSTDRDSFKMFSVNFYSIKVTEIDENANNVGLTKETFDKMDKIKCYLSLSILAIFVNKIFMCVVVKKLSS